MDILTVFQHWTPPILLTLAWLVLPFFVGFSIYLLPQFSRPLALGVTLTSLVYGLCLCPTIASQSFYLVGQAGVTLTLDSLSGYFIITNALVTLGVLVYCWHQGKTAFFYTQVIILEASVNAVFICGDFISLYVALEVLSIAAFLLITYSRRDRTIWVGLRYLFVGNTAMLFYLLGAILVYQRSHTFAFSGVSQASPDAIALIFMGLLTKGGIFVSGFWLPLTHSESETPVSALLSGSVVKTGVFPLVRLALLAPELDPLVRLFGVATALLGVTYAILAKDSKRMLAFHTISQLGFILAAPIVGGFYALTHGLVKSALFLIAGNLPSRNFKTLKKIPLPFTLWLILALASFSISGVPLLAGFGAKALTVKNLLPWQELALNIAAVGTAISFAKFIFLPWQGTGGQFLSTLFFPRLWAPAIAGVTPTPTLTPTPTPNPSSAAALTLATPPLETPAATPLMLPSGLWPAMAILLGGLVLGNGVYPAAYALKTLIKAGVTLGLGWCIYGFIVQRLTVKLPTGLEQFEHLIGIMGVMLIFILWKVMS
ncbi:cation:proton antiporter [Prochlorothrix hollandica]|uniref:Monovalent cation/H+ antiporter subunit D n=1 Tax=Prochlorothrix hollandica PCC 9006 = CALU 1027 TaxID=317619 RepID=A0A0M2Q3P2_PROHO|nr:cation:proton antiporter [Prochlorothrix hollandica]KKJ01559.1 monovalent cation/H+ antiporter subunit D [Prochlorothrix hollandica PCC 9006 = CALU 1027]